jgi:hypothetical protein
VDITFKNVVKRVAGFLRIEGGLGWQDDVEQGRLGFCVILLAPLAVDFTIAFKVFAGTEAVRFKTERGRPTGRSSFASVDYKTSK